MRRGLLLVCGFAGSLLAALLLGCIAAQGSSTHMYLPCAVEQTPLQILELRSYDGPFVEDGSHRPVRNVAALVLFNPSELYLEKGAVKIWQEGRLLVFSFTCIPPGARVLVLEHSAKLYDPGKVNDCWGWCVAGEKESLVQVEEVGRSALAVTNLQQSTLGDITVYYKDYDPMQKLYIGGISHNVTVRYLRPGHRVVVPAFMYLSGRSMVVK